MSHLSEAQVQQFALRYLHKHYSRKAIGKQFFAREEVRTRKEYGAKRADGLLVFRHWLWGRYVVSMEAKSYKTMPALKPRLDPYKLIWNSLKIGVSVCLLSGAVLALYRMSDGLFQYLLPLNVLVWSALLYGFLTFGSNKHKVVAVVEQLMHYPANEQWLAFSVDCFAKLSASDQNILKAISKEEGVGILLVNANGRVNRFLKASVTIGWWKDYSKYYSLGRNCE
jgi:hypothetical protein